jgi:hypothetical protein
LSPFSCSQRLPIDADDLAGQPQACTGDVRGVHAKGKGCAISEADHSASPLWLNRIKTKKKSPRHQAVDVRTMRCRAPAGLPWTTREYTLSSAPIFVPGSHPAFALRVGHQGAGADRQGVTGDAAATSARNDWQHGMVGHWTTDQSGQEPRLLW